MSSKRRRKAITKLPEILIEHPADERPKRDTKKLFAILDQIESGNFNRGVGRP